MSLGPGPGGRTAGEGVAADGVADEAGHGGGGGRRGGRGGGRPPRGSSIAHCIALSRGSIFMLKPPKHIIQNTLFHRWQILMIARSSLLNLYLSLHASAVTTSFS